MQNKYEILELFPTPIYTTQIPDELADIITFFDNQEIVVSDDPDVDNYGFRSKDTYILDKPECNDISMFILDNVKEYSKNLGYDYNKYFFTQSWISVKTPGQHHITHSHPNSLISGVFFYGPNVDHTPAIRFHTSILGINVPYIQPKMITDKKELKYNQHSFSIKFEPGLLILFPSYLYHSVPINKTNKNRCSLAFNIVPEIGFGDERNLTELSFKKQSDESKLRTKKK